MFLFNLRGRHLKKDLNKGEDLAKFLLKAEGKHMPQFSI